MGDGFRSKELDFIKLIQTNTYNDGFNPLSFGGFQIQMSLNKVLYSRAIYSVLDLLGDVGGLYSILLDIGSYVIAIVTFLFGSSMEKFLSSGIFNKHSQHHTLSRRPP